MWAFLLLSAISIVANGQVNLTLSQYSYTAVEGSNITVNCTHGSGATVSLSTLSSAVVSAPIDSLTYSIFTIVNVSRLDNNKEFTCYVGSAMSPPATLTVWYLTVQPQFLQNLSVISTPGLFFLNISITANPLVIPGNIAVIPPSGVSFPAQFQLASVVGDTGIAYVMLDRFLLPQYAGNYGINITVPAVGTATIQFNLTVTYAPRYTFSVMSSNATFNVNFQPGSTANLSCAATAVPQPSIVGLNASFNNATNMYTFPQVSPSNAGSYICVASNTVGSNTITYILNVGASPTPSPTNNGSMLNLNVFICILVLAIAILT